MPELRKDPIVGRWVIIAEGRAERPNDFDVAPHDQPGSVYQQSSPHHEGSPHREGRLCPFCEGNEKATPDEIVACREPGTEPNREGWRVRVVANKFPALQIDGEINHQAETIYRTMPGIGVHEVIIESPDHLVSSSELSEERLREVLWIYRSRLRDLKKDPRLVYGMVFKNVGAAAGASIEHIHSQLIATPIVPTNVWEEMTGSLEFYKDRGQCVYCDMVRREAAAAERVVLDTPGFLAFTPFASRFPFETWIVPKVHASHYEEIGENETDELSRVMRQVLGKVESTLDQPAYNYIIHTSPFDTQQPAHYHWHIEIMPSMTKMAGFEWGTGFHINPVPPERAAKLLREVEVESSEPEGISIRETG